VSTYQAIEQKKEELSRARRAIVGGAFPAFFGGYGFLAFDSLLFLALLVLAATVTGANVVRTLRLRRELAELSG
jgi:hypothetical protein